MIFLELGKRDKFWRILYILGELQHEKTIVRKQLAEYFQVDAKTIQRDLEDLRTFLDEIIWFALERTEAERWNTYALKKDIYWSKSRDPG